MLYKTFTITLYDNDDTVNELNSFVETHKVLNVEKNLIQQGDKYYWNFLIEYVKKDDKKPKGSKKPKVDYKEVLKPEDFAIFSKLREIRKKIAEENSIPVYTVFTNEQLAEIVKQRITSKTALSKLSGVGEQKINLASPILDYVSSIGGNNETSGKSV